MGKRLTPQQLERLLKERLELIKERARVLGLDERLEAKAFEVLSEREEAEKEHSDYFNEPSVLQDLDYPLERDWEDRDYGRILK